LYKKLPFIINTNTSVLLCPINVWLHVSTKYIVTFRAIEQYKIQNHNCEHYLRVRVRFESYCYKLHITKIYNKSLNLNVKLNIKAFYVKIVGILPCCLR